MELVLLHEINAGTFARLYLAEARGAGGLDRIVAVKILREQWNEQQDVVSRTRDEARLLARLRHKNILRVEDLVEVDGQTAIIMEYVDGLDLKQLVEGLHQKRQRVPPKVALQIVQETASALEAAYFRVPTGLDKPLRVVHRDIKPSNVMVSVEGEVRVLDFGTARSSAVFRSAQTGALRFGSLKYMSPERREGDRGEHASDVYAMGLVLIELLRTDWLPLLPMDLREHDEALTNAIARLPDLGMPNRDWDLTLRQVLGQMVASDPAGRPNAEQVVKLMREFVEQAQGPLVERFALETVTPITRGLRHPSTGGSLAGTRLVVNAIGDADARRQASPPSRPDLPQAATRPPLGTAGALRPSQGQVLPAIAQSIPSRPSPSAHNQTFIPDDSPEPEEDPGAGNGTAMAVGAGLFVVVVVGILVLATVGAIGWWYYRDATVLIEVTAPPATAGSGAGSTSGTAEGTSTAAGGSAAPVAPETTGPAPGGKVVSTANTGQVRIALSGEPAQWIKLERDGATAAESRGNLGTKTLPVGDYTLSIKIVGRTPVKASVTLDEAGLELDCTSDPKQNVRCTGAKKTLVLKP